MKKLLALTMTAALAATLFVGCSSPKTEQALPDNTAAVEVGVAPQEETTAAETVPQTTAAPETTEAVQEGPVLVPAATATLVQASVERHYEIAQAKDNSTMYEITVPKAVAEGDFQALNDSLSRDFEAELKEIRGRRQEFVEAFEAGLPEGDAVHGSMTEGVVCRADSSVFSVKTVQQWYNGGTFDTNINGYSYRPSDGTLLSAADVFKDIDGLKAALVTRLQEEYPDAGFFDLEETIKGYNASILPNDKTAAEPRFSFALTSDAAVFWFSKYELAPGASGCQTVILPYRDYAYLLNEEFMVASENYFTPLELEKKNLVNGHEIMVTENRNQSGVTLDGVKVTLDGKETDVAAFADSIRIYAAVKDGKTWLYVFRNCEDDEKYITVIDLNGEVKAAGEFFGSLASEYRNTEAEAPSTFANIASVKQLTDPSAFSLSEGKNGPAAVYTVSEDGMPVKK